MTKEARAPLIGEQKSQKSRVLGWFALAFAFCATVFVLANKHTSEVALGSGTTTGEPGTPVGTATWGSDDETAINEGMFLPVEIDVDGKKEDAANIFWIGFTDDRKTKFNNAVTIKRHFQGPDCWSKWFKEVNDGNTGTKQIELFMHVPHEKEKLHKIKMVGCLPTRWEQGGNRNPVEVIALTCQSINYAGVADKSKRGPACKPGQDPRDCLPNEEYARYLAGHRPLNIKPPQDNTKCGCVKNPCDCNAPVQPVTEYLVTKKDPRDYLHNEEHARVYGQPQEAQTANKSPEADLAQINADFKGKDKAFESAMKQYKPKV